MIRTARTAFLHPHTACASRARCFSSSLKVAFFLSEKDLHDRLKWSWLLYAIAVEAGIPNHMARSQSSWIKHMEPFSFGRKGVFFSFVLFVSLVKKYRAGQASQATLLATGSVVLTLTCFWFSFESVPFHILLCTHVHHWTFSVVQDVCSNFFWFMSLDNRSFCGHGHLIVALVQLWLRLERWCVAMFSQFCDDTVEWLLRCSQASQTEGLSEHVRHVDWSHDLGLKEYR